MFTASMGGLFELVLVVCVCMRMVLAWGETARPTADSLTIGGSCPAWQVPSELSDTALELGVL